MDALSPMKVLSPEASKVSLKDHVHNDVKLRLQKLGRLGKNSIVQELNASSDPFQTISDLQSSFSFGEKYARAEAGLKFLDAIGSSRPDLYRTTYDKMKQQLTGSLDHLNESGLLLMLDETINFLSFDDLKQVPISIIKKLRNNIPVKYLNHLASKSLLKDLPLYVRQNSWEVNNAVFAKAIEGPTKEILKKLISNEESGNSMTLKKANVPAIGIIVTYIGQSERLFVSFANQCAAKQMSSGCGEGEAWGGKFRGFIDDVTLYWWCLDSWGSALDSSSLLLSYHVISLASPMTNILISTLKHIY